jgi:hypothetical protein
MTYSKSITALFLISISVVAYGQETDGETPVPVKPKIIAVANRANWCGVCKSNGERVGSTITPYTTKGLAIVINDLTDATTIARSKAELGRSSLYKQIYESNRKGVGKMLQSCGILGADNKNMRSGIITFIDAKTLN